MSAILAAPATTVPIVYNRPVRDGRTSKTSNLSIKPRTIATKAIATLQHESKSNQKEFVSLGRAIPALTAFIDSGSIEDAAHLFDIMPRWETHVWNVMIRGLFNYGLFQEALDVYRRMKDERIRSNNSTYPPLIRACGRLGKLAEGQMVHAEVSKVGVDADAYVCNALISMYSENRCIEMAEKVFDEMRLKDLNSWNTMIRGYGMVGDDLSSLSCFLEMQKHRTMPNRYTLITILRTISVRGCPLNGKEIHSQVVKNGYELDVLVQTSLLGMYCKCGKMESAKRLFDQISKDSVAAWNSMMYGYSRNSLPYESFGCLTSMMGEYKVSPDCATMVNLLRCCAQVGAVLEGKSIHAYCIRNGFFPHSLLETALRNMYAQCKDLGSYVTCIRSVVRGT